MLIQKPFLDRKPPLGTLPNYAHPLTPNVASWIMNEGSGNKIYDLINGNHGTFGAGAGAPSWVPEGLSFDGTDDNIDLITDPDFTSVGTIIALVSIAGTSNGKQGILCRGSTLDKRLQISLLINDNVVRAVLGDNTNSQTVDSVATLSANKKYLVGMTVDGSNVVVYIDGIGESTVQSITPQASALYPYDIGSTAVFNCFEGTIYTILSYDRALQPSQISQLHVNPYCWLAPDYDDALYYKAAVALARSHGYIF